MEGEQKKQGHVCIPGAPVRPSSGHQSLRPNPPPRHGLRLQRGGGNPPHPATRAAWHGINDRLGEVAHTTPWRAAPLSTPGFSALAFAGKDLASVPGAWQRSITAQ